MKCPVCKNQMIVVEHHRTELDYCTNCHGVWFDSHELSLLLNSMGLDGKSFLPHTIITAPEARSSENQRKCPICNKKMKKTTLGHRPAILIDICRRADGLWFDGGEVSMLIKQLAEIATSSNKDSQQQILTFLGELLKAQT